MHHPPISLENLTEQEKDLIIGAAKKKMIRGIGFYLVPFVVFGYLMFYVNNHYMSLGLDEKENLRSFINVMIVLLTILPARLFVNTVLRYRKALNAWQKKVFRGKITGKEGRSVFIAGQKLKLSPEQASTVNVDDEVIIGVSNVDDLVLSVDVLKPQA